MNLEQLRPRRALNRMVCWLIGQRSQPAMGSDVAEWEEEESTYAAWAG